MGKLLLILGVLFSFNFSEAANCTAPPTGLTPLNQLGSNSYQGFTGGLYPNFQNTRPAPHEEAGIRIGNEVIVPRDPQGNPDPNGKIGFIAMGMSNTRNLFRRFKEKYEFDERVNDKLVIVQTAHGNRPAVTWDPQPPQFPEPTNSDEQESFQSQQEHYDRNHDQIWRTVSERVQEAGLTRHQVQVIWVMQTDPASWIMMQGGFPQNALNVKNSIIRSLKKFKTNDPANNYRDYYPNLAAAYLSSRMYAGYASSSLNPEPLAFENAFSVKWIIEDQILNASGNNMEFEGSNATLPWLSWGPYYWADGMVANGPYQWECADLEDDGTHPSDQGSDKVADILFNFFSTDSTTKNWFLRDATPTQQTLTVPGEPIAVE